MPAAVLSPHKWMFRDIHSQGFHPGSFRKKISEENGRDGENKEVKYQRKRKIDTGHCQIQDKNQEFICGK